MTRCLHCQSRFLQTIDRRWLGEPQAPDSPEGTAMAALLVKRRCKRCKRVQFEAIALPSGAARVADAALWRRGVKLPTRNRPSGPSPGPCRILAPVSPARGAVMMSAYSRTMARPSDRLMPYLRAIARAQRLPVPQRPTIPTRKESDDDPAQSLVVCPARQPCSQHGRTVSATPAGGDGRS